MNHSKFILIYIFTFISINAFSQSLRLKLNIEKSDSLLLEEIIEYDVFELESKGCSNASPVMSEQYKKIDLLNRRISRNEFIQLSEHESPILRSYSIYFLMIKEDDKFFDYFIGHLRDTQILTANLGNFGEFEISVSDLLLEVFFLEGHYINYFNTEEAGILDTIFLNNENIGQYVKWDWFEEMQLKEEYYPKLKELYYQTGEKSCLFSFIKYKKKKDKKIILELFNSSEEDNKKLSLDLMSEYGMASFYKELNKFYKELKRKEIGNNNISICLYRNLYHIENPSKKMKKLFRNVKELVKERGLLKK